MASQEAQDGRLMSELHHRTHGLLHNNSHFLSMDRYPLNFCFVLYRDTPFSVSYFQFYRFLTVYIMMRNWNRAYVYDPNFTMVGDHKSLQRQLCARSKVVDLLCLQTPLGDVCSIGGNRPFPAYFRPAFPEVTGKAD
jgi:hypothetical protein